MKKFVCVFLLGLLSQTTFCQVQRSVEGKSVIRESIVSNEQFKFFRDWTKKAAFKSGIGEIVEFYPIVLTIPSKKLELYGLQMEAEVKPQTEALRTSYSSSGVTLFNKDFIKRSIFIDKDDAAKFIYFLEKDVVPHLNDSYKKQSMEYIFKSKEMFFAFLIYEKTARITIHLMDYGPLGDGGGGGAQIEFWTEAKIDDIPVLLETLKKFQSNMK